MKKLFIPFLYLRKECVQAVVMLLWRYLLFPERKQQICKSEESLPNAICNCSFTTSKDNANGLQKLTISVSKR